MDDGDLCPHGSVHRVVTTPALADGFESQRDSAAVAVTPAIPPVTGDGDEAMVREIAERLWLNLLNSSGDQIDFSMIEDAARAGIARGRALGAREAFGECWKIADDLAVAWDGNGGNGQAGAEEVAQAVAARRAGRGTP